MGQKIPDDEPYETALTGMGKPFVPVRPVSFDIQIDREKCRYSHWDPTGCKKCIQSCPAVVFGAPINERRKKVQPQRYKLVVLWPEMCTGCGGCVRMCPHEAIRVQAVGTNP